MLSPEMLQLSCEKYGLSFDIIIEANKVNQPYAAICGKRIRPWVCSL